MRKQCLVVSIFVVCALAWRLGYKSQQLFVKQNQDLPKVGEVWVKEYEDPFSDSSWIYIGEIQDEYCKYYYVKNNQKNIINCKTLHFSSKLTTLIWFGYKRVGSKIEISKE